MAVAIPMDSLQDSQAIPEAAIRSVPAITYEPAAGNDEDLAAQIKAIKGKITKIPKSNFLKNSIILSCLGYLPNGVDQWGRG